MGAYSGLDDGTESAPLLEHRRVLRGVLKDEWGYDGAVISDWAATRTTAATAVAGLDLVMPGPDGPWGDALVEAVRRGEVDEAAVDDKILRLMRLAARVGKLTEPWTPGGQPRPCRPRPRPHRSARRTSPRCARSSPGAPSCCATNRPSSPGPGPAGQRGADRAERRRAVPPGRRQRPRPRRPHGGIRGGLRAALPDGVGLTVHRGGSSRRHAPFVDPALLTGMRAAYLSGDGTPVGEEVRRTGDWGSSTCRTASPTWS